MENLRRKQELALTELKKSLQNPDVAGAESALWNVFLVFEGDTFETVKGLLFTYRVKGHELFVDRKEKSITRSTVNMAFRRVLQMNGEVSGPKKIGTFGASYIYAMFLRFGLINGMEQKDE